MSNSSDGAEIHANTSGRAGRSNATKEAYLPLGGASHRSSAAVNAAKDVRAEPVGAPIAAKPASLASNSAANVTNTTAVNQVKVRVATPAHASIYVPYLPYPLPCPVCFRPSPETTRVECLLNPLNRLLLSRESHCQAVKFGPTCRWRSAAGSAPVQAARVKITRKTQLKGVRNKKANNL